MLDLYSDYLIAQNQYATAVSLSVFYGDIALPIAYEPICKDVLFCDIATKKVKRQSAISKNQMFRTMISQAMANGVVTS